jgi:hypothetical protein
VVNDILNHEQGRTSHMMPVVGEDIVGKVMVQGAFQPGPASRGRWSHSDAACYFLFCGSPHEIY